MPPVVRRTEPTNTDIAKLEESFERELNAVPDVHRSNKQLPAWQGLVGNRLAEKHQAAKALYLAKLNELAALRTAGTKPAADLAEQEHENRTAYYRAVLENQAEMQRTLESLPEVS